MLNLSLWAVGLGFFVTLLGLLEIVPSGPQGRNVIKHHLSRYLESATATFSFFSLTHVNISPEILREMDEPPNSSSRFIIILQW